MTAIGILCFLLGVALGRLAEQRRLESTMADAQALLRKMRATEAQTVAALAEARLNLAESERLVASRRPN